MLQHQLLTDDDELAERFRSYAPNQEADTQFMADVAAFEMFNGSVEQPLPAFTQKAAIGEEKLALFRDIVKEMPPGYDGILPLALELELRKSFNLVGITYSELWYKLVRKVAPLSYIQLRADNPYGQDISAITQTTDKRETCVLFILGRSNEPLLTFEFCHQL